MAGVPVGDDHMVISKAEYNALKLDSDMLEALEFMGVDNWEGYSTACQLADGDLSYEDV